MLYHYPSPLQNYLRSLSITLHPTPKHRLLIPPRELRPVIRQPIIEPVRRPHQFIIPRSPPRAAQRQVLSVHVLRSHALRLHAHIALYALGVLRGRDQTPPAAQRVLHDGRGQVRVGAVLVRGHELAGQVVDDVGGLDGREQADGGAVAEEAQVPVVGDDVHGAGPGYLGDGGLARADVVVGADVAAVEADAGPEAEHLLPGGGVEAVEEGGGEARDWVRGKGGMDGGVGIGVGVGIAGRRGEIVVFECPAMNLDLELVVHSCETYFGAFTYSSPDLLFGGDQVCHALAHLCKTDERCHINNSYLSEDVH